MQGPAETQEILVLQVILAFLETGVQADLAECVAMLELLVIPAHQVIPAKTETQAQMERVDRVAQAAPADLQEIQVILEMPVLEELEAPGELAENRAIQQLKIQKMVIIQ